MTKSATQPHAIIIGAGVGGLATAALLGRAGWRVDIYEQHGAPGGRAGLWEHHGFRFDTGPSWYLMPEAFEHFYELLGERVSDHLDLVRLDPAYKVFFDYHDPLTVVTDEAQVRRLFDKIEPGAGDQLGTYLDRAERTYATALSHFLYNPFGDPATLLRRDILSQMPFMAQQLLTPIDRFVGRQFKSKPLRQILEYPTVFLGASPYNAPALYHLMSYLDIRQGVQYPRGGLYTIVSSLESLGRRHGVKFHYNAPVERILVESGRARGVAVHGRAITADLVISNADLHFTETKLLDPAHQTYPASWWRRKTAGPSALLMYLGVKGKLPQLEHHNLIFVDEWARNFGDIFDRRIWPERPSVYVCKPSATDPTVAPEGHENLFVLIPLPAGATESPDLQEAGDRYLRRCADILGISDLMDRLVIKRYVGPQDFMTTYHAWQGTALGMAHTLPQSAMFRPGVRSSKVKGLAYVGAGVQPGIGLPLCLMSAELLYKSLIGDQTSGPLPRLAPPQGGWHV